MFSSFRTTVKSPIYYTKWNVVKSVITEQKTILKMKKYKWFFYTHITRNQRVSIRFRRILYLHSSNKIILYM